MITEIKKGDRQSFYNSMRYWLNNIKTEFKNHPIVREVNKNQEKIRELEEIINSAFEGKIDEEFTNQERQELLERLDQLEKNFNEKLNQEIKDNSELENKLKDLQYQINVLKEQVNYLNKKNWFLSFSTKTYLWYKENPAITRLIGSIGREMLPEEIKKFIPEETLDYLLPVPETISEIDEKKSNNKNDRNKEFVNN